jgi:hypothetical protein
MGRWLFVAVVGLLGCQAVGPVQRFNQPPQRVDDPRLHLTPEEQQRLGRARISYPNNFDPGPPPLDYRTRQPDP